MDCVINRVIDSSIQSEFFSCLKMFIMQCGTSSGKEIKRMGSYTIVYRNTWLGNTIKIFVI